MQQQKPAGHPGQKDQILSFRIGTDDYAVDILRVQEIRRWEKVRALPDSPDYVKGVLDMRGTLVPIVDLRVRFGNPAPDYSATTVVIVVSVEKDSGGVHLVGAVVDSVSDVLDVDQGDFRPTPDIGGTVSRRYFDGVLSLSHGMVVLLNLDSLFGAVEGDEAIGQADR